MHALARRNPSPASSAASSAAFRRWFGASKVVNAKGEPLVVYHGTDKAGFDAFENERGVGIYFTADYEAAQVYAGSWDAGLWEAGDGQNHAVYPVYLRIVKPLRLNANGANYDRILFRELAPAVRKAIGKPRYGGDHVQIEDIARVAPGLGFDGIVVDNVVDDAGHEPGGLWWRENAPPTSVYVVFEPTQVKSANMNAGTFAPADPSILRNPRRNPAPRYVLLGVDDEVQVCDDCGKADLKCTVVLGVLDADGNVEREVRFGRSCAAKALRKPSTTTANKMESLAREAEYQRAWNMRVGPGVREQVAAGRIPIYVTSYLLEDGRTLLVSSQPISPPRGTWTRLGEGRLVGHPAKTNPRRGGRR
jgi:hypothetical protein